jgi:glycosyltransferase involved in cell wall biosynthesis
VDDLISVIVPVYNAELYLAECIESLINQTYQNIEIILVDDGSSDHSYEICKQYAIQNNCIKLIHQENAGSTNARKKGLLNATGNYVVFVDSDDWIDKTFCDVLYQLACGFNAELVISGCIKEHSNYKEILCNKFAEGFYSKEEMKEQIYPYIFLQGRDEEFGILQYLCTKLYKKSLIMDCINRLDERIFNGEDAACILDICLKTNNVVVNNSALYHYRIRENSICTSEPDESYFINAVYLYSYMRKIIVGYEDLLEYQLKYVMARFINNGTYKIFGFMYSDRYGSWELSAKIDFSGKRIALFGAGSVGKAYCKQLCDIFQVQDIQIFDSKLFGTRLYGFEVKSPDSICSSVFDYVIIAAGNEHVRKQIYQQLLNSAIPIEKIISTQPIKYTNGYELKIESDG